jgi:hypothetical protein
VLVRRGLAQAAAADRLVAVFAAAHAINPSQALLAALASMAADPAVDAGL